MKNTLIHFERVRIIGVLDEQWKVQELMSFVVLMVVLIVSIVVMVVSMIVHMMLIYGIKHVRDFWRSERSSDILEIFEKLQINYTLIQFISRNTS
jgi:hypothetical protein